jgi:hypothetical protein
VPLLLLLNPLRQGYLSKEVDGLVVVRATCNHFIDARVAVRPSGSFGISAVVAVRSSAVLDVSATVLRAGYSQHTVSARVKSIPTKRVGASILGSASTRVDLTGNAVVEHRIWGDSG